MSVNIGAANIAKVRLAEQGSDPATPPSGFGYVYEKSDGGLYFINDAGTVLGPLEVNSGWIDYSATSTVVGWSAFTGKLIRYQRIGKLVYVYFRIAGTSNSTTTTFTLPITSANTTLSIIFSILLADVGVTQATPGRGVLAANSNTVSFTKTFDATEFTATGDKTVQGSFFYEIA